VTAIDRYNNCETDEQLEEIGNHLTSLAIPFQEKCVGVAHHIKNIEADETAIEAEIARLKVLLERTSRDKEFFKRYLASAMLSTNTDEIKVPTLKLSFRKSESVEVEDEAKVPDKYKRRKEVVTVDKVAIKEAWKQGVGVEGTRIVENKNLQIK
jgi:hypothetical protein